MQTGTLILEGLEQGGRDALMTLWVIASAGVSALIIGGLIAVYLICRNDAKDRKADRLRLSPPVRTVVTAQGRFDVEVEGDQIEVRRAA